MIKNSLKVLLAASALTFTFGLWVAYPGPVTLCVVAWWCWFILGCCVLGCIDHEDRRLFRWSSSCPVWGGYELTVMLWPVVAWYYLRS